MAVFLDISKRRKFYFRGVVVACVLFFLVGTLFVVFGLARAAAARAPISYADAAQMYHYYYSAANAKKVALTIDDGPHPPVSQVLIDTLSYYRAPATFFYIGDKALLRPDLVQEAHDKGFEIGIHSFDHGYGVDSSHVRLAFELNATNYLLSGVTDSTIQYYRPPYLLGIGIDPTINPYIPTSQDMLWSLELGYLPVGSDIDPKDWLANSPEQVMTGLERALAQSPNGHIILLHEDVNTGKAMPQIIAYLRGNGYTIVPLSQLLTPPADIVLAHTLSYGDTDSTTGGDVSKLQWFLYRQKYLDPYELTGVFDDQTQGALSNFQTSNHLITTSGTSTAILGVADAPTRALIHAIALASVPPGTAAGATYTPQNTLITGIEGVFLSVYIRFFPYVDEFFVGLIYATLLLVISRMLVLIALLWWRARHGPLYGAAAKDTPMPPCDTQGVSVLIPAYNEQENIASTIESVIRSTHRVWEIVVIDDGSKDNTANEVRRVIEAYPSKPIVLIQKSNSGKASSLNVGVNEAKHDIIAILDADAILDTEALGHFVAHFVDERVAAVAGKVSTTRSTGLLDLLQSLEYAVGQNIDKKAFGTIGGVGVVPGPAGAWRRSMLLAAGGFHADTLVEDQEMTLCMLRMGKRVVYEPLAIAYTETPHTLKNFLAQRFRWVYGTMQCLWKHKGAYTEDPTSMLCVVALPNIVVYNTLLPLTYPFADSALVFGIIFGQWATLVLPFLVFTFFDMCYAFIGIRGEPRRGQLMLAVPLQRLIYRWLLYYTVMRSLVCAIEGSPASWNKFSKIGETRRFFLSLLVESGRQAVPSPYQLVPEEVTTAFHGPFGTALASTNAQEVVALSVMPRQSQSAGETSSPARAPKVLEGYAALPNTYATSSSPLGPTSSH
jgi:cellulose synthase/poly-beta-1,6-N-acetylglucosamine synthase-like glycosyltransferase/peptidoglycan/xylan/chitin deacetylase (PgdA/CDA1 family)